MKHLKKVVTAATVALALALAGCGQTGSAAEPTLENGWAKAHANMSGVFGTLTNPGKEDITLVEASTPEAGIVEMHETVLTDGKMMMQEKEGGFLIPAGGTFELEPGADHIMLMDLKRELLTGEELELTLKYSDGSTSELTIIVREFAGAIEEYAPGDHDEHANHGDHGEHSDHGDHSSDDEHSEHDG